MRFAKTAVALEEEVHLRAEGGTGLFGVEVGEEGIVFAVEDATGVHAVGEGPCQSALADADGAFDDNVTGRLEGGRRNQLR